MKTNIETSPQTAPAASTPTPWCFKHEHPAVIQARKNSDDRFPVPSENWHWGITRISTPCGEFCILQDEISPISARKANAALIVQAVNSRAGLLAEVAALRAALGTIQAITADLLAADGRRARVHQIASEAIALAQGGVQS